TRAHEEPRQRVLDPDLEAAEFVAAELVELEELVDLGGRRGMPVCARREPRQDLPRASRFLGAAVRMANEDLAPARRIAGTFRIERSRDRQRLHGARR